METVTKKFEPVNSAFNRLNNIGERESTDYRSRSGFRLPL